MAQNRSKSLKITQDYSKSFKPVLNCSNSSKISQDRALTKKANCSNKPKIAQNLSKSLNFVLMNFLNSFPTFVSVCPFRAAFENTINLIPGLRVKVRSCVFCKK